MKLLISILILLSVGCSNNKRPHGDGIFELKHGLIFHYYKLVFPAVENKSSSLQSFKVNKVRSVNSIVGFQINTKNQACIELKSTSLKTIKAKITLKNITGKIIATENGLLENWTWQHGFYNPKQEEIDECFLYTQNTYFEPKVREKYILTIEVKNPELINMDLTPVIKAVGFSL